MRPMATGEFGAYLRKVFPNLDFVPIAFTTAKSGKNVYTVLNLAQNLHKQASRRAGTPELNRVLRQALEQQPPPMRLNRRPKISYATQVATNPPTIVLITNGPELLTQTYQRYLLKMFRDHLPFTDVPMKLYLRHKHREDEAADGAKEQPAKAQRVKRQVRGPDTTKEAPSKAQRVGQRVRGSDSKKERKRGQDRQAPGLWKDL